MLELVSIFPVLYNVFMIKGFEIAPVGGFLTLFIIYTLIAVALGRSDEEVMVTVYAVVLPTQVKVAEDV